MDLKGIFVFFHCGSNTGYAIGRRERDFFEMSRRLVGDTSKIHFGYVKLSNGIPKYLADNLENIIEFDPASSDKRSLQAIRSYVERNKIEVAFGFDQPVFRPVYPVMRNAGVRLLISYWGAPISSINRGIKLLLKKVQVNLTKSKPDHFIFQSKAMADRAIYGRGIGPRSISVIPTGVDTEQFKPGLSDKRYAHEIFHIPKSRRIVFYSGHMEERKGVHVIVEAANQLIRVRKRNDVHFLFLGNRDGEEKRFAPRYVGTETENYLTFGGYRDDVDLVLSSCYSGVVASTGWDSFPMSSLEMMSSGLPLVASNLQGIVEQIEHGETGYLVEPGNPVDLAAKIEVLLDSPELQSKMGAAARQRVIERFSREKQIERLVATVRELYASC